MRRRLIGWFLLLPLSLVLIVFALANRQTITLNFDPTSETSPLIPPVHVPLFLLIYVLLIAGILLGGVATWFTQGKQRREKRHWRKHAARLEKEAAANSNQPSGSLQLANDR
ncbi:MAG: LapA family protein [Hyphomicrobiaceae bacterium]|nr:LapA family protein [Hyphomicrobiaceae bacterium]